MSPKRSHRPDFQRTRASVNSQINLVRRYTERRTVTSPPGSFVDVDSSTPLMYHGDRSMDDWVAPGAASRIANGEIINHPMSSAADTISCDPGSLTLKDYISNSNVKWDFVESSCFPAYAGFGTDFSNTFDVESMKRYAQTQALSKVNKTGFMGLVFVGEAKKTLSMLTQPLSFLNTMLAHLAQLRKGNKNITISRRGYRSVTINGKKFVPPWFIRKTSGPGKVVLPPNGSIIIPAGQAISGAVLANNLGLRPLMMDIQALLHGIPEAHRTERNTARGNAVDSRVYVKDYELTAGVCRFGLKEIKKVDISVKSTAITEDYFSVANDFGVSLWDISEAAWELIPYSFIVDYFVNVGDSLGALRSLATNNLLMGCTVVTVTTTITRTPRYTTAILPYQVVSPLSGQTQVVRVTKARTPFSAFDFGLAMRPSPWRPTVFQNLLSLTVQQLTHLKTGGKRTFY